MDSYPIFPFYLVIDTSLSMTDCLPAVNDELPRLKAEVEIDPIVGDIARFGIVTFSDEPTMVLPLSDLLRVDRMPVLAPERATNFTAVFDFLTGAIEHDMTWYRSKGSQVYRPAVFFITDGQPSDQGWRTAHQRLTDPNFAYHPNIVSFGFGDIDEATLAHIATFKAFAANRGESPTNVLQMVVKTLTRSIMASSRHAATGVAALTIAAHDLPNMHEIAVDLL